MSIDDDEVKALENRLRASGWATPGAKGHDSKLTKSERKARVKLNRIGQSDDQPQRKGTFRGFGAECDKVLGAGRRLARECRDGQLPLTSSISERFGLTFDEAVRAKAEAERRSRRGAR